MEKGSSKSFTFQVFFRAAAICCLLLGSAKFSEAQTVPSDFSGDGLSDVFLVEIDSENNLDWSLASSDSDFTSRSSLNPGEDFGKLGYHLIPGYWTRTTKPELGYLSESGRRVKWAVKSGGQTYEVTFGRVRDQLISGGDYDGDGKYDAALLRKNGKARVRLDPFGETPTDLNFRFGKRAAKRGEPFFLSRSGEEDALAILYRHKNRKGKRRFRLVSEGVNGEVFKHRLAGRPAGKLQGVYPIGRPDGTDGVLVKTKVNKDLYQIRVYDPATGKLLFRNNYESDGTVLVGSYIAAVEGEVFGIRNGNQVTFVSPFVSSESAVRDIGSGVVVDHVNINTFQAAGGGGGGGEETPTGEKPKGGLASVCSSVSGFSTGRLWKPESDVSDARGGKPAYLLTGSNKAGTDPKSVYASDGTEICILTFKAGQPGINNGADHFYSGWHGGCALSGSQMASRARAASGSSSVYVEWKGGACLEVGDPRERKGGI